jgi:hypothetical protein
LVSGSLGYLSTDTQGFKRTCLGFSAGSVDCNIRSNCSLRCLFLA